jgi:Holliday junction resolvase
MVEEMTETEQSIQNSILRFLKVRHIFAVKTIVTNRAGTPDILAIHPKDGRFLAIEVKTQKGVLSPLQTRSISAIQAAGGHTIIARWLDDVKKYLDN